MSAQLKTVYSVKERAVDTTLAVKEVELTAAQARAWEQARAKFIIMCPGFCHILYRMMNSRRPDNKAVFTDEVPIAATDGLYMLLNPATFFKYSLKHQVFIMAHEVCHAMLNHPVTGMMYQKRGTITAPDGTVYKYHHEYANIALDFIINDMLAQSTVKDQREPLFSVPTGYSAPLANALHDPTFINMDETLPSAYAKVYKDQTQNGGKKSGGKAGTGNNGFDVILAPGKTEGKPSTSAAQARPDAEWKTAVAAAMASAAAQGLLPAGMKRMFEEVLEPRVAWEDYIEGFFRRKVGGGAWNWRKPDRRLIIRDPFLYAPDRSGHGADTVVVAVDTSGSINNETIAMFLGEVTGVLDNVRPRVVLLMWCDAKVHRVDEIEDTADLAKARYDGAPGGGGTSFVPVFEEVYRRGLKPDALLYLTDGHGTFPKDAPDYPLLWGSIDLEEKGYPCGEVVMIPKQAKGAAR